MKFYALLLLGSSTTIQAFSPPIHTTRYISNQVPKTTNKNDALFLSSETETNAETPSTSSSANPVPATKEEINKALRIPQSYNEMIQQTSQAMMDAYNQMGMSRQIVRILLPRDASSGQLGEYYEAEAETSGKASQEQMKLVPCDESWQGGIMQLYRAASPTTKDILRQLSPTTATTGVPPKIIEDRDIDESGVDGVGLFYTQTGSDSSSTTKNSNNSGGGGLFGPSLTLPTLSETDMCIFVQPTQEVVDTIEELSNQSTSPSNEKSSPLIALLNPQWRNVDDALDVASKSDSLFGQFASFLGGKGSSLRRLDALGYRSTYTLEGYVCKGGNIRLIKRFDSDWIVFAENDKGDEYVRVGEMVERPKYQDVEGMLEEKGVGYKYARDLGLAPKL
mmetsp:Transcript_10930/g.21074  ORF Transcript_10930/g.21074 Transcript_10930/m.21074 type:complete len:393 (+) Transcript_10930:148-1326(+)